MENPRNKPLLLLSRLRVVQVREDGHPNRLDGESSWRAWKRAWALLEPAVAEHGEHTQGSVLEAMGRGMRQLWVGERSAVITEILRYPSGLVGMNTWLAAGDLEEIQSWISIMERWGRENGATISRVKGRRGWLRVSGYKECYTVMERDLRHDH